jgi:predicted mannosyl-3-phosphoglycerate phosphatase (HAD superfamily)
LLRAEIAGGRTGRAESSARLFLLLPAPSDEPNSYRMDLAIPELCLRQTSSILFIAVDSLIPVKGKSFAGLDEFTATLDHQGIPAVWVTSRSRLHFDEPRRKLGHTHPFIAEDGCAVYLPEDYFHLRPESVASKQQRNSTVRLGRFTCIPLAEALPAAAEALETLSEDTGVPVVTLRSLSPRELVQNTNLPHRDAELSRQRDFDEVFFFAGVSDQDVERFLTEGRRRKLQLRQHGVLWSVAIGASVQRGIRELSRLYDRALRYHAHSVGIATPEMARDLFPFCERTILLSGSTPESDSEAQPETPRARRLSLRAPDIWERVLGTMAVKN